MSGRNVLRVRNVDERLPSSVARQLASLVSWIGPGRALPPAANASRMSAGPNSLRAVSRSRAKAVVSVTSAGQPIADRRSAGPADVVDDALDRGLVTAGDHDVDAVAGQGTGRLGTDAASGLRTYLVDVVERGLRGESEAGEAGLGCHVADPGRARLGAEGRADRLG